MIVGLHHVSLSVPDIDRALEFYRDTLGFEQVFGGPWENKPVTDQVIGLDGSAGTVVMLRLGNAYMELWEFNAPVPTAKDPSHSPANHGIAHFCLQVTEIESEYERLSAAGMTFHRPPVDLGKGRSAIYGRDPFGNILELYQVTGDAAIPGT